jgi:hypothetical protein
VKYSLNNYKKVNSLTAILNFGQASSHDDKKYLKNSFLSIFPSPLVSQEARIA